MLMELAKAAPLMPDVDFQLDPLPDFHARTAKLRETGPVVPVKINGVTSWFLTDFRTVDRAFRDYENFSASKHHYDVTETYLGRSLMGMEGEQHRRHRGIVQPAFTFTAARNYIESILEPTAHEVLDRLNGQDEVDIRAMFGRLYPFTVITKLLGVPLEHEKNLISWASAMISFIYDEDLARKSVALFDAYIRPILEERRRRPSDDLISHLLTTEVAGERMTDEQVMAFIRVLYPAGGHSTSFGMTSAIYCMLAHPEAKAMVMHGAEERWAVVQEALRWEPAFGTFPRVMLKDVEIGGVTLEKDDLVWACITSANHDPKQFRDPDRFDPHRENLASILTFGRNAHMCLGRNLATREIDVALRVLCERFPNMELAPHREVVFAGTQFRTCEELWVRLNR